MAVHCLVRRSPHVVSERFGAETVVLDPMEDRYVRLNATGSRLWEAVEEGEVDAEELAAVLVREWVLPPDRAQADVAAFLATLAAKGLIELTPR